MTKGRKKIKKEKRGERDKHALTHTHTNTENEVDLKTFYIGLRAHQIASPRGTRANPIVSDHFRLPGREIEIKDRELEQ